MIKVLIVEDSPVAQEFLTYIFSSDPEICVVSVARNGSEALEAVKQHRPDVITMDIHMPIMDGFEATRRIIENIPTPIVIVSASSGAKEVSSTFRAIEAGALAIVLRPPGLDHDKFEAASKELIRTVKMMSEVKVVKRTLRAERAHIPTPPRVPRTAREAAEIEVVAIGASTGGPVVLQKILSCLPQDLPVPLLIVQHIAPGFDKGFVEWLSNVSRFPLHIASHGEYLIAGHGYVAPNGCHMGVKDGPRIVLSNDPPENCLRPSVAFLFRTVAETFGPNAVGVLLTGMGKDGAKELKMMSEMGAITIAQDEASSIVHGMPGEAIKLNAASYILPPESIAAALVTLASETREKKYEHQKKLHTRR